MSDIKQMTDIIAKYEPSLSEKDELGRISFRGRNGKGISLQDQEDLRSQHELDENAIILLWIDNNYDFEFDANSNVATWIFKGLIGEANYEGSFILTDEVISAFTNDDEDGDENKWQIFWKQIERVECRDGER